MWPAPAESVICAPNPASSQKLSAGVLDDVGDIVGDMVELIVDVIVLVIVRVKLGVGVSVDGHAWSGH